MNKRPVPFLTASGYRLRFSVAGTSYLITGFRELGGGAAAAAEMVSHMIWDDYHKGRFDTTLKTYKDRINAMKQPAPLEWVAPQQDRSQLDWWDLFVASGHLQWSVQFRSIRKYMKTTLTTTWFKERGGEWSRATMQRLKTTLVSFDTWLSQPENLGRCLGYAAVKLPKKVMKDIENQERRAPLTQEQILDIYDWFENQDISYLEVDGKGKNYLLFVRILLECGLRPAEAIGLRWSDIDWHKNYFNINSSLSRKVLYGGQLGAYERKPCKSGESKKVPINKNLSARLAVFHIDKAVLGDHLIFHDVNFEPWDWVSFRTKVWKQCLKELNIPYRVPYACRHSYASHALAQGVPITEVAASMGHKDLEMLSKNYAHSLGTGKTPTYLPPSP